MAEEIVRSAYLIGKEPLEFTGSDGNLVKLDKLTFMIQGAKNSVEVKVFYPLEGACSEEAVSFKDLSSGKIGAGELTYVFRREFSDNQNKEVWKPKFVSYKA